MLKLAVFIFSFISFFDVSAQFSGMKDISQATTGVKTARAIDMDADGDEDVLIASAIDHKISYYQNLGSGDFATQVVVSDSALGASDVFAADIDGDGDLDILSSSVSDNKLAWYKNVGGMFEQEQIISTSVVNPIGVSAADFDGDGDQDVVAASSSSSGGDIIVWFENLGGVFGVGQTLSVGSQGANDISIGDIDQDGDADILYTVSSTFYVQFIENLGSGTFASTVIITGTGQISQNSSFSLVDADDDGDLDLLNCFSTVVRVSLNDGMGNFSVAGGAFVSGVAISASLSDIDDDGDKDLTIGITSTSPTNPSKVVLLENTGNFSFGAEQIISTNLRELSSVYSSDYDNDGDIDLFSTSYGDGKWALYENVGGALGSQMLLNAITDRLRELRIVDVDFDGDMDVFTAADKVSSISWYENLGGGVFSTRVVISDSAQSADDVFVADIDQDGDNDVVSLSTKLVWYENLGGNNFSVEHFVASLGSSIGISSMHVADFDNDGDNDIAISGNSNVVVYQNLGSGTFSGMSIIGSDFCSDLHAVDLNGDGFLDILGAEYTNDELVWYENLTNGTFSPGQTINITMDTPLSVHSADIDLDGDMDVLGVSQFAYKVVWHENLGGGNFSAQNIISLGGYAPRSVYSSDMDNDGDFDVLVGTTHDVLLMENLGAGVFGSAQVVFADDFYSVGYSPIPRLVAADMDENGVNDIVALDGLQQSVLMFENFQTPPFILTGKLFYDENLSSNLEPSDLSMGLSPVSVLPGGDMAFSTPIQDFVFGLDSGIYVVNHNLPDSLWMLTTDSTSYTVNLNSSNPYIDSLNFGFYPNNIITHVSPDLTGAFPRCNQVINYWPSIQNLGSTTPSGSVCLELDQDITFVSSTIQTDSIVGQSVYFSFDSLGFYSNESFQVLVQMPPYTSAGDTLTSYVTLFELDSMNSILYSNMDSLQQIVQCAYDPNDKLVTPQGLGTPGYILNDQDLEYTIRFQNTGTDTVFTVIIRDQLDVNLDWGSVYPIASSHPMQTWVESNGEIIFKFENILLPDSNVNEPASHGFVKFRISLESNLIPSTQIHNQASIYFDLNPAVITNLTLNTIYDCNSISLNSMNNMSCVNSDFMVSIPDESFNSYLWQLNTDTLSTVSDLIWIPDSSGTFDLNLTVNNELCQSDTTITAVVLPEIPETVLNQTVCQGDSTLIFGNYETTSGMYSDTIQSVNGCDSIVILNLTVLPSQSSLQNSSVCSGDSLLVFGSYETDAGTYCDTLQSIHGCDSIVTIVLTIDPLVQVTQYEQICIGDSLFIHGNYESTPGLYTDTVPSSVGCDTILSIDLSINPLNATVSNEIYYLEAAPSLLNYQYQWFDCDSNIQISGAVDPLFYPAQNGNYAVIIFDGNCSDTSSCMSFLNASTIESNAEEIRLYPNPTTGKLHLDFSRIFSNVHVVITDILGQRNASFDLRNGQYFDFFVPGASGIYYVELTLDFDRSYMFRVVKK